MNKNIMNHDLLLLELFETYGQNNRRECEV